MSIKVKINTDIHWACLANGSQLISSIFFNTYHHNKQIKCVYFYDWEHKDIGLMVYDGEEIEIV